MMWRATNIILSVPRIVFSRGYSTPAVQQSPLAILRRNTGYPFSKCKEALTRHNNDVQLAEQYLRERAEKEGWVKALKVKGRATKQGLIGVMVKDNKGVMIEVNCETDFVSKNSDFRKMVAEIAEATFVHFKAPDQTAVQHLDSSSMSTLGQESTNNPGTIANLVARNIGHFGENINVSRGCLATAGDTSQVLSSFVYNSITVPEHSGVVLGTYASLVLLRLGAGMANTDFVKSAGCNLGQHIVGMNPSVIDRSGGVADEGEYLVEQPYLFDRDVSVGSWLESNNLHVTEFVRYELGEQ